jgi:hypothetical protein
MNRFCSCAAPLLSGKLSRMKHSLTFCAAISLFMTAAIHADDSYSVKEATISRDEKRQQAILGVREFRCSYSLPSSPEYVQVIVEDFVLGEMRHRYRSQLALNNGQKTGSVSLAWLAKEREMVTLVDTGHPFSPFAKRQLIDTEDFDEPMDIWFFSKCQKNQGMIPLFGICGQRSLKMGSIAGQFEAPQEFVAACNSARSRFSWVVYLYVQGDNIGGWPVFDDGK